MDIHEFKSLYEEMGEVVAKLRVDELVDKVHIIAEVFPKAFELMDLSKVKPWVNAVKANLNCWKYFKDREPSNLEWQLIISSHPHMRDECPIWNVMPLRRKLHIFRKQPHLLADFMDWDELNSYEWSFLIRAIPQLAHLVDFQIFEPEDAILLVAGQPHLANQFDFEAMNISIDIWLDCVIRFPCIVKLIPDPTEYLASEQWANFCHHYPDIARKALDSLNK